MLVFPLYRSFCTNPLEEVHSFDSFLNRNLEPQIEERFSHLFYWFHNSLTFEFDIQKDRQLYRTLNCL